MLPKGVWVLFCFAEILFLTQHWIFAQVYLRVALIFELAFSSQTEEVEERKTQRMWWLSFANFAISFALSVSLILMIIIQDLRLMSTLITIMSFIFTIVLTFALFRLKRLSKFLESEGIIPNRTLVIIHLTTFWIVSLLGIAMIIIQIYTFQQEESQLDLDVTLVQQIIAIFILLTWFVMMSTILVMFIKNGTHLTPKQKLGISMRFVQLFKEQQQQGAIHLTSITTSDNSERAKAHRKFLHDRMLADRQIKEILETLMSVTDQKGLTFAESLTGSPSSAN